jgi:hypothetical protein
MNQRLNSRNINEENLTGVVIQSLDVSAWYFFLCQISIVDNYCDNLIFHRFWIFPLSIFQRTKDFSEDGRAD